MASKHGLKRMRTTSERRDSLDTQGVKVRPARTMNALPSHWDDHGCARQPRSDCYKNHRRPSPIVL